MRSVRMLCAGAVVVVAGGAAIASAHPSTRTAGTATVELRQTSLGMILVNSSGFTLYEFSIDKKKHDNCVSISECPEVWPPLLVSGAPTAGPGIKQSKLSTITLPGGAQQVTYYKHPLYRYSRDVNPGETSYVGANEFGGIWYAINAKGRTVN